MQVDLWSAMKRFAAIVFLVSASANASTLGELYGWDTSTPMQDAREKYPELAGLDDEHAVQVIQRTYYPELTVDQVAQRLGVKIVRKKRLGPIDRWRFESCQSDAAKAPTAQGVSVGVRVCNDKFGQ